MAVPIAVAISSRIASTRRSRSRSAADEAAGWCSTKCAKRSTPAYSLRPVRRRRIESRRSRFPAGERDCRSAQRQCLRNTIPAMADAEKIEAVGDETLGARIAPLHQPRVRFVLRQVLSRHHHVARFGMFRRKMIQVLRGKQLVVSHLPRRSQADVLHEHCITTNRRAGCVRHFEMKQPPIAVGRQPARASISQALPGAFPDAPIGGRRNAAGRAGPTISTKRIPSSPYARRKSDGSLPPPGWPEPG